MLLKRGFGHSIQKFLLRTSSISKYIFSLAYSQEFWILKLLASAVHESTSFEKMRMSSNWTFEYRDLNLALVLFFLKSKATKWILNLMTVLFGREMSEEDVVENYDEFGVCPEMTRDNRVGKFFFIIFFFQEFLAVQTCVCAVRQPITIVASDGLIPYIGFCYPVNFHRRL